MSCAELSCSDPVTYPSLDKPLIFLQSPHRCTLNIYRFQTKMNDRNRAAADRDWMEVLISNEVETNSHWTSVEIRFTKLQPKKEVEIQDLSMEACILKSLLIFYVQLDFKLPNWTMEPNKSNRYYSRSRFLNFSVYIEKYFARICNINRAAVGRKVDIFQSIPRNHSIIV